jgi:hypothetical protein
MMKKNILSFLASLALATTLGAGGCATTASSQKEQSPEQVLAGLMDAAVPKADGSKAPDGSRVCVQKDGTQIPCSAAGAVFTPPVVNIPTQ